MAIITILIWLLLATVVCGLAVWGLVFLLRKPSPSPPAPGGATQASSAPATSPTTSAVQAPRSWGWIWILLLIAGLLAVGWWAMQSTLKTTAPKPQIRQPEQQKHIPQKYKTVVRLDETRSAGLTLVGKAPPLGDTHFMITDCGKALMFANVTLDAKGGTAYFKGYMSRSFPGPVYLDVNGTRYEELHNGGGRSGIVFRFPAQKVSLGKNTFFLSSPGDNVFVEKIEIEIHH